MTVFELVCRTCMCSHMQGCQRGAATGRSCALTQSSLSVSGFCCLSTCCEQRFRIASDTCWQAGDNTTAAHVKTLLSVMLAWLQDVMIHAQHDQ